MKKARIILIAMIMLAGIGGAFAFKASRFNTSPVWRYTKELSTFGTVYSTSTIFCTALGATRYLTTTGATTTVTFSIGPAIGNITLEEVGGTHTFIIGNQPCALITTRTTAAM
ncbi:hypothetical protein [Chitinophaga filiformis]|uniref:Uncharacterized protein n=1 Tax=Chitinophaga filiformis TaxID=104663 RepID=A0ABY4I243_CHIFI|nr:hypothetical protein [Chitinophaga filiformis]UPK69690.1 hypothetical protein MYF79_00115 [Chitinophaga filiformis]